MATASEEKRSCEKPLIFSAPMVRALLAGRKTRTMRVIKNLPPHWDRGQKPDSWGANYFCFYSMADPIGTFPILFRAPIQVGDLIWVRETIHMPKAAARIWLRVTKVDVQRPQDLTFDEQLAEGVVSTPQWLACKGETISGRGIDEGWEEYTREVWRDLWNHINVPGAWERNDWCFVYGLERIEKPQLNPPVTETAASEDARE